MARLTKISDTEWIQPFVDREKEYHLWGIPTEIANLCNINDGDDIRIKIQFPEIDAPEIERLFHITSGREISFPKEVQNVIVPIVQNNRNSHFLAKILDVNSPTLTATDIEEPSVPGRTVCEVSRIIRDTKLSKRVKELHGNKCQICGTQIPLLNGKHYSEAHHIKPLGGEHQGLDVQENIIVVCPNHHSMLDYGAIKLDIKNLTSHLGHEISKEYIEYHNEFICKSSANKAN